VQHVVGAARCRPEHVGRLHREIERTDATMGGTEMQAALQAVFAAWPVPEGGADVLLITDGEVWQAGALVAAALGSGHRVFAIGVGSAPAESVLRELAEVSGGAVEFATPGESLQQAAARMMARIRQRPLQAPRVDWGAAPVWEVALPPQAFGGDTALALAGFGVGDVPQGPVRLLAAGEDGHDAVVASTVATASVEGQDLARMAAARRLAGVGDDEQATQLALDYQLVSRHTHCLLVHERAPADRPARPARLQQVPGMLAAGWGGSGSARFSVSSVSTVYEALSVPSIWRSAQSASATVVDGRATGMDALEIPAFLRRDDGPRCPTMRELMRRIDAHLERTGSLPDLAAAVQGWELAPPLRRALEEIDSLRLGRTRAWVLFALWVAQRPEEDDPGPARRLAAYAQPIAQELKRAVWELLERHLGPVASDGWQPRRPGPLAQRRPGTEALG
jgi:Ca-activated chloride channel family protein